MRVLSRRALLLAPLLAIAACAAPPPVVDAAPPPTVLEQLPAAVVAVREEVQLAAPVPAPAPAVDDLQFASCATGLVTRWEVGNAAAYTRKWQGVIWPGGSSGPTWGIGYDGGYQTRLDIARDWSAHLARKQLVETSGVVGSSAQQRLPEWREIRTNFSYAQDVFVRASLPSYAAAARRALGPGFVSLPSGTRCALVSLGYNRGWQTAGERRREVRTIRDQCIPGPEPRSACVAQQLRAMKRLWPDTPGLQARREEEARTIERALAQSQAQQLEVTVYSQPPPLPYSPALPRRFGAAL